MRAERLKADERNRQRYNDLAQQVLKSEFVPGFEARGQPVIRQSGQAGSEVGKSLPPVPTWAGTSPGKREAKRSVSRFPVLHQAGMTSLDVIRAITTNAAEMLGWQDRIGSVEPGKFADLTAVAGDPITDITELERVRFIMKDGKVIKNELSQ